VARGKIELLTYGFSDRRRPFGAGGHYPETLVVTRVFGGQRFALIASFSRQIAS
jgi:hypothetical protein